jgi:endonuclease YncB( thermonuclease family)
MRQMWLVLIAALFTLAVTSGQEPKTRRLDPPKVERKEVHGQWRFPNDKFIRIHGRVNVIDAHTLRYEDGTDVDLNGGMDAPDLAQKGLIDGKLYPAGEEAAEFLRKLIGDKPVTSYAGADEEDWSKQKKFTKVDAFLGETCLNHEMMRNGWAMAHHTSMAPWEAIARENKRGIWRGEFILPEKWRKGERLPGEK